MVKPTDPCKVHACKIQKCLQELYDFVLLESNFREDKCQKFIEYLRECCVVWGSKSISCSGIDTSKKADNVEGEAQSKHS